MLAVASRVAFQEIVLKLLAIASIRPRNSPGTFSIVRPKKSLSCVLAISTAMPLVNPTITGRGMNFTAFPRPVTPSPTSMTPAISVQLNRPFRPYFATIP